MWKNVAVALAAAMTACTGAMADTTDLASSVDHAPVSVHVYTFTNQEADRVLHDLAKYIVEELPNRDPEEALARGVVLPASALDIAIEQNLPRDHTRLCLGIVGTTTECSPTERDRLAVTVRFSRPDTKVLSYNLVGDASGKSVARSMPLPPGFADYTAAHYTAVVAHRFTDHVALIVADRALETPGVFDAFRHGFASLVAQVTIDTPDEHDEIARLTGLANDIDVTSADIDKERAWFRDYRKTHPRDCESDR